MVKIVINEVPGLVKTWWDDELQALSIKWFTEYAEGTASVGDVVSAERPLSAISGRSGV